MSATWIHTNQKPPKQRLTSLGVSLCGLLLLVGLVALTPDDALAQQWAEVTMISPTNNQHVLTSTISVQYRACSTFRAQSTNNAWVGSTSYATDAGVTLTVAQAQCDSSIRKKYTASNVPLKPGANTVKGDVCNSQASPTCQYAQVTAYYDPPPAVATTPQNGDFRDVSRCVANCFEHVMAYSTPEYVSRNASRSLTIVYRSGSAHPVATIALDVIDSSTPAAAKFKLQVRRSPADTFVTFLNGAKELYFANSGTSAVNRLVAAFDASTFATGSYAYDAIVTSMWTSTSSSTTKSVRFIVLNESGSAFGAGWTLAGYQKLYVQSDGVLVTDGTGSASFFSGFCAPGSVCTYTAPGGDFSTLTRATDQTFQRRYPDGTVANFGTDGRQTSLVDRFGVTRQSFAYSGGSLASVTDAASKAITLGYEAGGTWKANTVNSLTSPGSRASTLHVDQSNNLVQLIDPDGIFFGYADYNSDHRVNHFRDRRGGDWNFTYAWQGTRDSTRAPAIDTTFSGAGPTVRPTSIDSSAHAALFAAIAGGAGTSANPVAQGLNPRASSKNPRGFVTYFTMNCWGSTTRITTPVQNVADSSEYDAATGHLTKSIGIAGHEVRYTWTGSNLTRVVDASTSDTVNAAYESTYNQVDSIWGNAGPRQWFYYNAGRAGKPLDSTRVGSSNAHVTQYTIDTQGRVTRVVDLAGHVDSMFYAANGFQNTDSLVRPGHRATKYTYDAYGRGVASRIALRRDSVEYDLMNRAVASVDGLNRRTTFGYDSLFLRTVFDPAGKVDSLFRNALGLVIKERRPGYSNLLRAIYDVNGNVITTVNRRGQAVRFAYDALDRDSVRASSDTARWVYGAYSTPVSGVAAFVLDSNSEARDSTLFDVKGRVKRRTVINPNSAWYKLDYTYNRDGSLASRDATSDHWTGSKTIQYAYNPALAVQSLTAFGQQSPVGLNTENLADSIVYPNGLVNKLTVTTNHETFLSKWTGAPTSIINDQLGTSVRLNADGTLKEWRRAAGDSLKGFIYAADGSLSQRQIYSSTQACQDPVISLDEGYYCQTQESLDHSETYTYDNSGNLTNGSAVIDGSNRVTSASGFSFYYDDDGNLTYKSGSGFANRTLY